MSKKTEPVEELDDNAVVKTQVLRYCRNLRL